MVYFHSPWKSARLMLIAAISASDTTMPLGYWPVSSWQRTVRPVLVVVAEISSTITRSADEWFGAPVLARARFDDTRCLGDAEREVGPPLYHIPPSGRRRLCFAFLRSQICRSDGTA